MFFNEGVMPMSVTNATAVEIKREIDELDAKTKAQLRKLRALLRVVEDEERSDPVVVAAVGKKKQ